MIYKGRKMIFLLVNSWVGFVFSAFVQNMFSCQVMTTCILCIFIYLFIVCVVSREAVSLARVRLSPHDPILADLYMAWGDQLAKDHAYEQAAKW